MKKKLRKPFPFGKRFFFAYNKNKIANFTKIFETKKSLLMKKKKKSYFSDYTFAKNEHGENPNYKEKKTDFVTPKKQLGQHFLMDKNIAQRIVEALTPDTQAYTLEIGAGTGVLTDFLWKENTENQKTETEKNTETRFFAVEIDKESVEFLHKKYPTLAVAQIDVLRTTPSEWFAGNLPKDAKFRIISNFPYNISSQVFFKILDYREQITEVVGMLQEEVARRFSAKPNTKDYGILSVFLQAFYEVEYLFGVPPEVFNPPPKVNSGVIRLRRNEVVDLGCDEQELRALVKLGFGQRRKTLGNAIKILGLQEEFTKNPIFKKRAENLSVADWIMLTNMIKGLKSKK